MIVQPNFLDHWKTRLLQTELAGDPLAPTYVLRLWGHCQEQKTHRFPRLSANALAAICCVKTPPEAFWVAMQTSGFILVKNELVEVHEWDKYNSGLVTSWVNGKKGGRPKKPTGNPRVTRSKPGANPDVTDREDREDKIESIAAAPRPRNLLIDALATFEGIPLVEIGKSGPRLGTALAAIKAATPSVTPDEITRRGANLRTNMPDVTHSASSLAKWWGPSSVVRESHGKAYRPEPILREVGR